MRSPNLVWITLDSVRADHTSMGGYNRETTPNLERVGTRGVSFDECISHAKWTAPSSASMLTGTYPTAHMVGVDEWRLDEIRQVPRSLRTVPELLGEAGYRTACISNNNHISESTGLTQGFDRFDSFSLDALKSRRGLRSLVRFLREFRTHSSQYTLDYKRYNHTFYLDHVARQWLSTFASGDDPFFLYVHNNDPHHPYTPPIRYRERFADDVDMSVSEMFDVAQEMNDHVYPLCKGEKRFDDEQIAAIEALYDATIAYVDEWIGELFRYVRSLDAGPTVFVVTADHGDLFGERGLFGHNVALDDGVIHVPMVVHGLEGIDSNSTQLVQPIDVMQTFLATVGADVRQFQGVDLRTDRREFAVAQRGKRDRLTDWSQAAVRTPLYPDGVNCLRNRKFKYERGIGGQTRLYHLPDEETDVTAEYPERAEEFDEMLEQWLGTVGQPIASEQRRAEYTPEMKEQLRDMGYI